VCALSSPAIADEVALHYEATGACPDRAAFQSMVTERLGYSPFADGAAKRAAVTLRGKRARIAITESGQPIGERTLRAANCTELAETTALAIAIAIDAQAVYAEKPEPSDPKSAADPGPGPGPGSGPGPEPESKPAVEADAAPAPTPGRDHRLRPHVAAGVVAALGASPDPTAGATLQLGLRRGPLSLDLEGRTDRASHVDFGTGRVHASLTFAAVIPCYHRGRFAGCGVLAVGALRGRGEDFVDAARVTSTFAAGGARVAYEVPIADRISARLHADLLGAFARTSLQVSGMDVWTLPPVSGAAGVSAVGHFQ
jgi:hypothetical protein